MRMKQSSSKSGLFLIELIIATLFFAVASAICVQLFVKAHLLSTRSGDLGTASLIAQNAAEVARSMDADTIDSLFLVGSGGEHVTITLSEYYDETGKLIYEQDNTQAVYLQKIVFHAENAPLFGVDISVYKVEGYPSERPPGEGEAIFSLHVNNYRPDSRYSQIA